MKTIAVLGPSVRLLVVQFLVKSTQVPAVIPPKNISETPPLLQVSGVKVLESTPQINVSSLATKVLSNDDYRLVDAWHKPHETNWGMSFVRFVFCRKEHVKLDGLHPDFVAKFAELGVAFSNLVSDNLWATQGYLNPYFEKDVKSKEHKVLMFGCAGRVPAVDSTGKAIMVYRHGRNDCGEGIGPKIPMIEKATQFMVFGDEIVLMNPEPVSAQPRS